MLIALDIYYSSILLVIHHTTAYIQVNPSIIRLTHRSKTHRATMPITLKPAK